MQLFVNKIPQITQIMDFCQNMIFLNSSKYENNTSI